MGRRANCTFAAVALAGCFRPTLHEGDPCEDGSRWCPPPLSCSADNLCTKGGGPAPDGGDGPSGDGGNNYAFVTSTNIFTAQLSNDQADAECRARASGILPGDFHAWFSATDNAVSRFDGPTGTWLRPDGHLFALDLTHLLAGKIAYPLRLDEHGIDQGLSLVATQTGPDGTLHGEPCGGTVNTGAMGFSDATTVAWTFARIDACISARLYCLATGGAAPPPVIEPTGKLVFVSSGTTTGDVGSIQLDVVCRTEATVANLPNATSFIALVARGSTPALGQLFLSGPWVRPDGIVAIDALKTVVSPLNVTLDQRYLDEEVWGGAVDFASAPASDGSSNCTEWTGGTGRYGRTSRSDLGQGFGVSTAVCTAAKHVYCVDP